MNKEQSEIKTQTYNLKDKISQSLIENSSDEKFHNFIDKLIEKSSLRFLENIGPDLSHSLFYKAWETFQSASYPHIECHEDYIQGQSNPRLFLIIANNDRPFLVDTLQETCKQLGFTVENIVHPVIKKDDDIGNISLIIMQIYGDFSFEIPHIQEVVKTRLSYVYEITSDLEAMKEKIQTVSGVLDNIYEYLGDSNLLEVKEYLQWLQDNKIIFLGYRYFENYEPEAEETSFLCLSHNESENLGLFKFEEMRDKESLTPGFTKASSRPHAKHLQDLYFFEINKTNFRAPIHRSSRIDSFEILDFEAGEESLKIKGLHQFIGVYSKSSFQDSLRHIPLIKNKVQRTFDDFNLHSDWHDGKRLASILNSIPHDELFHLENKAIRSLCQRILYEMTDSVITSIRFDPYSEHVSIVIFVPVEKYHSDLQEQFANTVLAHLKGEIASQHVLLGNLPFARFIYVVNLEKSSTLSIDQLNFEKALNYLTLRWEDFLLQELKNIYQEKEGKLLYHTYNRILPKHYKDQTKPENAAKDIFYLEQVKHTKEFQMYFYTDKNIETNSDHKGIVKLKIFSAEKPLSLSFLLPTFKNLGMTIDTEISFSFETDDNILWLHDLTFLEESSDMSINSANKGLTREVALLLQKTYIGELENDELNKLILTGNLSVREVTLMRAFAKYLKQTNIIYSYNTVVEALNTYPNITADLVALFKQRFCLEGKKENLAGGQDPDCQKIFDGIHHKFQQVERLDHDTILRRYLNLIHSIIRTNYFQLTSRNEPKEYISFKMSSRQIFDLPLPVPLYEIFVYSSRMEGIHLRGDKVARGGIRWSDRFDDFRQEILGLMKAQMVKNSIIIPLGSKGGFVVKRQKTIPNDQLKEEVIYCYKTLIKGLLDLTDNIKGENIEHPSKVVRYDDEDPYLVVAADKGTATFSDIANGISKEYEFWLDDAFASGGSKGYDHKKMGITAKGAWESVKHHFSNLRIDLNNSVISVVGVGDMSGDVFGNGMLLSDKIKLTAAFNHQHIFIDPSPDTTISYNERKRLFQLPQSSWNDYNPQFISPGGGVFSRNQKNIPITPQMKKVFGVDKDNLSASQLIQYLLKSRCDLLWLGGIGTYVKAYHEQHYEVSDRQNDEVRINAGDLKAKVVGEGANLGFTQCARIEYALQGGHINTDAVDNSAGVSCSDHEVNLKIFFKTAELEGKERDNFLEKMTSQVEEKVLYDNKQQNKALTFIENIPLSLVRYEKLLEVLREEAELNTAIEYLPEVSILIERRKKENSPHFKLLRPEWCVLMAYSKIHLYKHLLAHENLENSLYINHYKNYFPTNLQTEFGEKLLIHPLRKQITATVLANEFINYFGIFFLHEIAWMTNLPLNKVIHHYYQLHQFMGFDLNTSLQHQEPLENKKNKIDKIRNALLVFIWTGLPTLRENLKSTFQQLLLKRDIPSNASQENILDIIPSFLETIYIQNNFQKLDEMDEIYEKYRENYEFEKNNNFNGIIKKFVTQDPDELWKWSAIQNYLKEFWMMKISCLSNNLSPIVQANYQELLQKIKREDNLDVGYLGYLICEMKKENGTL